MIKDEEQKWLDKLCIEEGCPYLAERGYILCERCLHGNPIKTPEEILKHFKRGKYYKGKK